jgi:hypothetical protein
MPSNTAPPWPRFNHRIGAILAGCARFPAFRILHPAIDLGSTVRDLAAAGVAMAVCGFAERIQSSHGLVKASAAAVPLAHPV